MAAVTPEPMDAARAEKQRLAALELARLIRTRFGDRSVVDINAGEWERFLLANWDELSDLAHLIHAKPR